MNRPFVKGLDLSQRFYEGAVRPILSSSFPAHNHSAASIGQGSDILGFDTPQSMDHDWGPKLRLFLAEADLEQIREAVDALRAQIVSEQMLALPLHLGSVDQFTDSMGVLGHLARIKTVF